MSPPIKYETHDRHAPVDVSDYNLGQPIPDVCCGDEVKLDTTTTLVRNTNLVATETYAHLIRWQCIHTQKHQGKGIILSNDILS